MANKNTSGFEFLMQIDDRIISIYNGFKRLKFTLNRHQYKYNLSQNINLKNKHIGQRCFIVGNGPSIQSQDLTLLKNEWTFFVNHFYHHPKIAEITPKYYTIVDPKLMTGEWKLSMLDEIIDSCPEVTFLLSAKFQDDPQILAYAEKTKIYWIYGNQFLHKGFYCPSDLTKCLGGTNVIHLCLFAAIYMGFEKIYLMGIDCDGIFHDLLNQSSHFYNAAKENIGDNDPELVAINLRSTIQGFRGWSSIADKFKNSSHKIINLTAGGLLNSFTRDEYVNIISSNYTHK